MKGPGIGYALQVQKAEGAFASPIEVQETAEFTLPPPSAQAIALPVRYCASSGPVPNPL